MWNAGSSSQSCGDGTGRDEVTTLVGQVDKVNATKRFIKAQPVPPLLVCLLEHHLWTRKHPAPSPPHGRALQVAPQRAGTEDLGRLHALLHPRVHGHFG